MLVRIVMVLCLGLLASGCAVSRSVIDVAAPEIANPAAGVAVKVTEVRDRRAFQIDPPQPSIPSLKNEEQTGDPAITSRAIARKRNTYGMALGDILLPPEKSVAGLTRSALENALRNAGYTVLSQGDPGYDSAPALTADIRKFWGWMNPGAWEITVTFEADLKLEGDWPVAPPNREIYSRSTASSMVGTESLWKELFDKGIADLTEQVTAAIQKR